MRFGSITASTDNAATANLPTLNQKAALTAAVGIPSALNPYVLSNDPRLVGGATIAIAGTGGFLAQFTGPFTLGPTTYLYDDGAGNFGVNTQTPTTVNGNGIGAGAMVFQVTSLTKTARVTIAGQGQGLLDLIASNGAANVKHAQLLSVGGTFRIRALNDAGGITANAFAVDLSNGWVARGVTAPLSPFDARGGATFSNGTSAALEFSTVGLQLNTLAGNPAFVFKVTDAAAHADVWDILGSATTLSFRAVDDAFAGANSFLLATRNAGAATIASVQFPNGLVGIGPVTPTAAATPFMTSLAANSHLGGAFISATAIAGTAVELLPADAARHVFFGEVIIWFSSGTFNGVLQVALVSGGTAAQGDGAGTTITITFVAGGQITAQRTAGAATADLSGWCCWV